MLAIGSNKYGQLGTGNNNDSYMASPCLLQFSPLAFQASIIRGGGNHTVIVDRTQELFVSGCNESGELGLEREITSVNKFTKVEDVKERIIGVGTGWNFTLLVTACNQVYGCGDNNYYQLTNSLYKGKTFGFRKIGVCTESEIKGVECGLRHSVLLTADGVVYGFGNNKQNQLGVFIDKVIKEPTKISEGCKDVKCGHRTTVILTTDGKSIIIYGNNKTSRINMDYKMDGVESGWSHFLAFNRKRILAVGLKNHYYQLGSDDKDLSSIPDNNEYKYKEYETPKGVQVRTVKCTSESNVVLTSNNKLFMFGWNEHGTCGLNPHNTKCLFSWDKPVNLEGITLGNIGCGYGNVFFEYK